MQCYMLVLFGMCHLIVSSFNFLLAWNMKLGCEHRQYSLSFVEVTIIVSHILINIPNCLWLMFIFIAQCVHGYSSGSQVICWVTIIRIFFVASKLLPRCKRVVLDKGSPSNTDSSNFRVTRVSIVAAPKHDSCNCVSCCHIMFFLRKCCHIMLPLLSGLQYTLSQNNCMLVCYVLLSG